MFFFVCKFKYLIKDPKCQTILILLQYGGGANQPLINSLNTLNTLKNSNPKELAKNLNKIQNSNQLDLNHLNELKDSRFKESKSTKRI